MPEITPETLIRSQIRELNAYHVPPAGGLLKLDAMENPYAWPGELSEAWQAHLSNSELNRYPDPAAQQLKARLRTVLNLPSESTSPALLLGNGSDELIQLLALAVLGPDRVVLAPEPSFSMYRMIALFTGLQYVGVPLRDDDFSLDEEAMLAAIEQHRPALVFLAYPNNPSGNLFDARTIERIIALTPGLVVLDEAYAPFTDASFISQLAQFDNLLVMRTLSKMGLAGLRLGYLLGAPHWLHEINKLRLPYNINTLTQLSAEFALRHEAVLRAQTQLLRQQRSELSGRLAALPGVTVYPSEANFVLLRVPSGLADTVHARVLACGILIKNLHSVGGLLCDCLRLTVGTPQQNQQLFDALQAALD
jgi:histidinol-phosphate aminotransferase